MSLPPYKNMFREGEVLLVNFQQQPSFYIRIEKVEPDVKKRWWRLHFITLTTPINPVTWILDDDQMRGAGFTMEGHPIHIERIENIAKKNDLPPEQENNQNEANIVSLFD